MEHLGLYIIIKNLLLLLGMHLSSLSLLYLYLYYGN